MKNHLTLSKVCKLVALAAVFSFSMLLAQNVSAQGKQDFTVHNHTGVVIAELYVSPHSSNAWQEDVLGRDVLADGESVEITFSPRTKPKLWDIKIVDKDGDSLMWESLNLLEISEVTLYFENGKAWAEFK